MPGNIGITEIAIVLVLVLIIFGPKRLPELGRSLGKGIREFKGSVTGLHDDDEEPVAREIKPGELTESPEATPREKSESSTGG